MLRATFIFLLITTLYQCKESADLVDFLPVQLDKTQASRLAALPLGCIEQEYPNKPGQTLASEEDIKPPHQNHPAFYGCFDWHSSVHGHWSLVSLLKEFPELDDAKLIQEKLSTRLAPENIEIEAKYFNAKYNRLFERTYGWAWLLKLAEELHTWDDPLARQLETNLQPLTTVIIDLYLDFLPRLQYPVRVGTHSNTAFGLNFAWDYAKSVGNDSLLNLIRERALNFYLNDVSCPIDWEPGGYDFLSPCLEEAALMKRVLTEHEFQEWLLEFLPQLHDKEFALEPGIVSDREDGHLVHLDGVNFSRAWCLNTIAAGLPEYHHLNTIANDHILHSLHAITDGNYEGSHWLASFAIMALKSQNQAP